jgi:hypothetical protein
LLATELDPVAVELVPVACANTPVAVEKVFDALAPTPVAVDCNRAKE